MKSFLVTFTLLFSIFSHGQGLNQNFATQNFVGSGRFLTPESSAPMSPYELSFRMAEEMVEILKWRQTDAYPAWLEEMEQGKYRPIRAHRDFLETFSADYDRNGGSFLNFMDRTYDLVNCRRDPLDPYDLGLTLEIVRSGGVLPAKSVLANATKEEIDSYARQATLLPVTKKFLEAATESTAGIWEGISGLNDLLTPICADPLRRTAFVIPREHAQFFFPDLANSDRYVFVANVSHVDPERVSESTPVNKQLETDFSENYVAAIPIESITNVLVQESQFSSGNTFEAIDTNSPLHGWIGAAHFQIRYNFNSLPVLLKRQRLNAINEEPIQVRDLVYSIEANFPEGRGYDLLAGAAGHIDLRDSAYMNVFRLKTLDSIVFGYIKNKDRDQRKNYGILQYPLYNVTRSQRMRMFKNSLEQAMNLGAHNTYQLWERSCISFGWENLDFALKEKIGRKYKRNARGEFKSVFGIISSAALCNLSGKKMFCNKWINSNPAKTDRGLENRGLLDRKDNLKMKATNQSEYYLQRYSQFGWSGFTPYFHLAVEACSKESWNSKLNCEDFADFDYQNPIVSNSL